MVISLVVYCALPGLLQSCFFTLALPSLHPHFNDLHFRQYCCALPIVKRILGHNAVVEPASLLAVTLKEYSTPATGREMDTEVSDGITPPDPDPDPLM